MAEWPDRGAGQWAVYIGGFGVIWARFSIVDAMYPKRQQAREGEGSSG